MTSAGTIGSYDSTTFPKDSRVIFYRLSLYFNQLALDENKPTIPAVTEFDYKIVKECTDKEWSKLNDAGSNDLVQLWLKEMLDLKLGQGNTKIV